jgi:hypothetical protein
MFAGDPGWNPAVPSFNKPSLGGGKKGQESSPWGNPNGRRRRLALSTCGLFPSGILSTDCGLIGPFSISFSSFPLPTTITDYIRYTFILGRRKIEDEPIVSRKQADEACRMKERFEANIRCELRTPLHRIPRFSEWIYPSPETCGKVTWKATIRRDIQ